MIIHSAQRGPTMVRVVNSRLPVYKKFYGDGFDDVVEGLFSRIAPKAIPIAKQLGMKAIDVIREKGISAAGDVAIKAFSAIRDRLAQLIRRPQAVRPQQAKLPSTEVMPASVSQTINQAANQKLVELADEKAKKVAASLIAASGLSESGIPPNLLQSEKIQDLLARRGVKLRQGIPWHKLSQSKKIQDLLTQSGVHIKQTQQT